MMLRIGYLTYLNVIPYFWGSTEWDVELVPCVPSEFGKLALKEEIDAGIMAVGDWFVQSKQFELLGSYGIATHKKAQSVLLFSNHQIQDLDTRTIGITEQSSTSVLLLKLLLEKKYSVFPSKYIQEQHKDAWLVIGDDALREKKKKSYSYIYDLGEEWWLWQELPFVFARWVVLRNLPSRTKEYLHNIIKESLQKNLVNLDKIASSIAMTKKYSVLSEEEIINYLKGFTYSVGNLENKSMNIFHNLLSQAII